MGSGPSATGDILGVQTNGEKLWLTNLTSSTLMVKCMKQLGQNEPVWIDQATLPKGQHTIAVPKEDRKNLTEPANNRKARWRYILTAEPIAAPPSGVVKPEVIVMRYKDKETYANWPCPVIEASYRFRAEDIVPEDRVIQEVWRMAASRPDLQFKPLQYVKVSDAFKAKHCDRNGYLIAPYMSPSDQARLQNSMLQRYQPAHQPDVTHTAPRNIRNMFGEHVPARVNNNPGQGGTQRSSVTQASVNWQVVRRGEEGRLQTEAALPANWATMRRDDGHVDVTRTRMRGALNADFELNHYAGSAEDGLASGGNELAKQMALFAVGAGVGMAIHAATHLVHRNDAVASGRANIGDAYAGEADGANAHAQFVGAHAQAGAGSLGARATAGAHVAHARAQGGGGIPGTGGLFAPAAEATALSADAHAEANIVMGARMMARVAGARAGAGLEGTPLGAGAELLGAGAAAGFHGGHIGGYVGAHLAEANAGPFAARLGLKFGAGLENGIPVVHLGPVSVCSIM